MSRPKSNLTAPEKQVLNRARRIGLAHAVHLLHVELQRMRAAGEPTGADHDDDDPQHHQQAFAAALRNRAPLITKGPGDGR